MKRFVLVEGVPGAGLCPHPSAPATRFLGLAKKAESDATEFADMLEPRAEVAPLDRTTQKYLRLGVIKQLRGPVSAMSAAEAAAALMSRPVKKSASTKAEG